MFSFINQSYKYHNHYSETDVVQVVERLEALCCVAGAVVSV